MTTLTNPHITLGRSPVETLHTEKNYGCLTHTPHRREVSYEDNSEIQNELHQEVVDMFEGVYNTDSDTSQASLDLSDGIPKLRVIDGKLRMFYGTTSKYTLDEVGQLQTDDKVFSEYSHIPLSDSVITVYKKLNKALHEKKNRLRGKYDCANMFIRRGITSDQFSALPKVKQTGPGLIISRTPLLSGDKCRSMNIFPVLKTAHTGDHDDIECEENFRNSQVEEAVGTDVPKGKRSKFAFHGQHRRRGKDRRTWQAVLSSPFPKTFGYGFDDGSCIAPAKTRKGYFYYWKTNREPSPNVEIERIPLTEIPAASTGRFEECERWGAASLDQDLERLTEIFVGAWVLKGNRLMGQVNEEFDPTGVLERMRTSFFRLPYPHITSRLRRVEAVLKRAVESIQRHGAAMFGFEETRERKSRVPLNDFPNLFKSRQMSC